MSAATRRGPHRAQRQASARDPRRRLHRRLGRRTVRVGKPALPAVLPSEQRFRRRFARTVVDVGSALTEPRRRGNSSTSTAATVSHSKPRGRTTTHRFPSWTDHVRLEWDSMDAWFEEDEEVFVHPPRPIDARADPPELPPRRCRGRGYRRCRVASSGLPLRDSAPASNVHPEARRRHGTAGAHRHNVAVPVQRHREVLDGHDRRRTPSRSRVELSNAAARVREHRRPGRLLRRTGRSHRRRSAPDPSHDTLRHTPAHHTCTRNARLTWLAARLRAPPRRPRVHRRRRMGRQRSRAVRARRRTRPPRGGGGGCHGVSQARGHVDALFYAGLRAAVPETPPRSHRGAHARPQPRRALCSRGGHPTWGCGGTFGSAASPSGVPPP